MKQFEMMAGHHSMTCFLNSLFLEWNKFSKQGMNFVIELNSHERIIIPIKTFSRIGRHHYTGEIYHLIKDDKKLITFKELVTALTELIADEFNTPEEIKNNFLARVFNSEANIESAFTARFEDFKNLYKRKINFKSAEQSLFIGHTFHPTPKSRSEFSEEDYKTYSPEMAGQFSLEWFLVSKDIFFQKLSDHFNESSWLSEIFKSEFSGEIEITPGFIPFPIHPWQKSYILKNQIIQNYIADQRIIPAGLGKSIWYPTSSLRTLYTSSSNYMLKFSMDVRLTNSIRHLLVHELDRGLQVHDVFTHTEGQKFSTENPDFEVIYEPAYAGLKDVNGNPIKETLMMGRFNPFTNDSEAIVLATLTQDHPSFEENLIQKYIREFSQRKNISIKLGSELWFNEFLRVALRPLIIAQANYGILLGSHQQNMIIEMKDSLPVKSYFRDCNGTGYSELGYSLFSKDIHRLVESNGNILNKEIAGYLFGYYVIINSTFNTISAIAHNAQITEEALLDDLRNLLIEIKAQGVKDSSFIDYLLDNKFLMHKGNFLCSFKNINENTESNPLSIYTKIPNPLYKEAHSNVR